jgi:hypothetical protein
MKAYTFTTYTRGREFISGYAISTPKIIEAMSLKKAIKLFKDEGTFVVIKWISRKGKDSTKSFELPIKTRSERKGRL